jgi:iron complex outermembrane recepter protein
MSNQKVGGVVLALLAGTAGTASTALAQSASSDGAILEEIVVTAEKRETNLQKTPSSIQVTSGQQLRNEGKQRLDEMLDGVVGVQSQGSEVGSSFYMRGVGFDRAQMGPPGGAGPIQQAVAVIVDGVYQTRMDAVRGGTVDVSQVEVMRGPQSTTLGGSSLAGAVSLVSNKPIFQYEARGSIDVGNYHRLANEAVMNIPLSSDQALRFAISTERHDGYIASGLGASDQLNARVRYRWKPNDDLDIILTGARQQIYGSGVTLSGISYQGRWVPWSECTASGLPSATITDCSTTNTRGYPIVTAYVDSPVTYKDRSNPWDDGQPVNAWGHEVFARTTVNSWSANIDWNLGFGTLEIVPQVETGTFTSQEFGSTSNFVSEHDDTRTRQVDVHLNSSAESSIQWLVGANYYYTNQPGAFEFVVSPGSSGPGGANCTNTVDQGLCYFWNGNAESSQRTIAEYANATLPVMDTLRLIGGVRYTKDEKAAQGPAFGPGAPPLPQGTTTGPSTPYIFGPRYTADWSKLTYRGGVEYDVSPKSMAYLTYSTGYQPGNLIVNGTATQAQTLSQWTIGIKNRFFDDSLQVNVEAFNSEYHNRGQQGNIIYGASTASCQATFGPPPAFVVGADYSCLVVNSTAMTIPNLFSRGADLEVNWLPSAGDRLDFSLEYLKATQDAPVLSATIDAASIEAAAGTAPPNGTIIGTMLAAVQAGIDSYNGATLQASSRWSSNVTYQHTFEMSSGWHISPKINASYKSSYWTSAGGLTSGLTPNAPGPAQQDAYTLWNGYLTVANADDRFTSSIYVKNIANKPVLLDYEGPGPRGPASISLGDPRTFGITFEASF